MAIIGIVIGLLLVIVIVLVVLVILFALRLRYRSRERFAKNMIENPNYESEELHSQQVLYMHSSYDRAGLLS